MCKNKTYTINTFIGLGDEEDEKNNIGDNVVTIQLMRESGYV